LENPEEQVSRPSGSAYGQIMPTILSHSSLGSSIQMFWIWSNSISMSPSTHGYVGGAEIEINEVQVFRLLAKSPHTTAQAGDMNSRCSVNSTLHPSTFVFSIKAKGAYSREPQIIGDPADRTTFTHILQIYGLTENRTIAKAIDIQGIMCYDHDEQRDAG
jgi:hypothetical protein